MAKSLEELQEEKLEAKLADGGNLTAADYEFLRSRRERRAVEVLPPDFSRVGIAELLEECVLRGFCIDGYELTLEEIGEGYGRSVRYVRTQLVRAELRLLNRYGFPVDLKAKRVSGQERQFLELLISIESAKRYATALEGQMHIVQKSIKGDRLKELKELMDIQLKIAKQRDPLLLKLIQMAEKRSKARGGRDITININDGELE